MEDTDTDTDLRPRQFGARQTVVPSKAEIRKYVSERLANFYHVDTDTLAGEAFSHFGGIPAYTDIPDIYYEVVEEMIL
jgi:hypothetical protein